MGLCGSSEAAQLAYELEKQLDEEHKKEEQKVKLLLLGAGESGKSTIFKQMRILYGSGFGEADRAASRGIIHGNIVTSVQVLIDQAGNLGHEIEATEAAERAKGFDPERELDEEDGAAVKALWEDPGIQATFEKRAQFQLNDCTKRFLGKAEEVTKPSYIPTVSDILASRVRTSGIVNEQYNIEGTPFEMYDVGGQRNERKKWINCFDNVTAVIFVAAISEYDQVLFEDGVTNRVDEAVRLFSELYSSSFFLESTSFILFLNKKDLFEEKLYKVDIKQLPEGDDEDEEDGRFVDYDGGMLSEDMSEEEKEETLKGAQEYMEHQFTDIAEDGARKVYPYVTCATDTKNVERVFSACKETILAIAVSGSGFMN